MYYLYEWITKNIMIHDTHFMKIKELEGDYCYIIAHHVKDKNIIEETVKKLLTGGFKYFNIFGEQSLEWEKIILKYSREKVIVEASKVANNELTYNLAMFSEEFPDKKHIVISDDEFFTQYLVDDFKEIIKGNASFTTKDWRILRNGLEFTYNGKDSIVIVDREVTIGFINDQRTYLSIFKGFRDKIFDGKSFYEIWEEIRDNM